VGSPPSGLRGEVDVLRVRSDLALTAPVRGITVREPVSGSGRAQGWSGPFCPHRCARLSRRPQSVGLWSRLSSRLLTCPYAAPSPRTSSHRPPCRPPRYAVHGPSRSSLSAARGLGSAAADDHGSGRRIVPPAPGASGCGPNGCGAWGCGACDGARDCAASGRGAGGRWAIGWGSSCPGGRGPGDRPSSTSGSAEAQDPDRAGCPLRDSCQTPASRGAGGRRPLARRHGGVRCAGRMGKVIGPTSPDRRCRT